MRSIVPARMLAGTLSALARRRASADKSLCPRYARSPKKEVGLGA
jgi:hypothetical protein